MARRDGVRVMRDYRKPRPAFAPPPPEPGAGSSRAGGRGKGPECHGTLRGPRAGEMEEGGRTGIGWARRRNGGRARPQSPARAPGLVGWKVAVRDEAGACAGGCSSAERTRSRSAGGPCRPPRRLRRRRGSGWVRRARELLRRNHDGSQKTGGGNRRGRAAREMGGRDGGTEDGTAAVFGAATRPCGLKVAVRDEAEPSDGREQFGGAHAEPICGGSLPSSPRLRWRTSSPSTAAPTTEELGAGAVGARAAPAQPRGLAGEGGVCVSELGGSSPSTTRPALARAGGRVAVRRKVRLARVGPLVAAR